MEDVVSKGFKSAYIEKVVGWNPLRGLSECVRGLGSGVKAENILQRKQVNVERSRRRPVLHIVSRFVPRK